MNRHEVRADRLARLRQVGYSIRFVDARKAYEQGYVGHGESFTVGGCGLVPFVEFNIRGYDYYGQSTTVDRSNFRSLLRDFGNAFIPVSYSNVDVLGGFPLSMPDEAWDTVISLASDYPLYDESDHSELESEEITASWDEFVWSDMYRAMSHEDSEWRDVADRYRGDEIGQAFWSALSDGDYYPEHSGLEVMWDYPETLAVIQRALCALVDAEFAAVPQDTLV